MVMQKLSGNIIQARRFFSEFRRNSHGVAAVEFALVLPFLLLLLLGVAELTSALNQSRKVSQSARTVGDLVAQAESLTEENVTDILEAADQIMVPYTDVPLTVVVSSVSFDDDGNPEVDWSRSNNSGDAWTAGQEPPQEIPEEIRFANTSIIVGYAESVYTPSISGLTSTLLPFLDSVPLSDIYYLRPRLTTQIAEPE